MVKYFLTVGTHFICCILILKAIIFVSPDVITCFVTSVFHAVLCLWFSMITFQFTKKMCLEAKVDVFDKAVFITGCDTGFGHLLAKRLDSKGYHVFAGCFLPLGAGASELKLSCSGKLLVVELDVTKEESVKRALEVIKNNLVDSKLWAIVNNAGILKGTSVELTSYKSFQDCMDVNAFGPLIVSKTFLPLLRQSKGRVVNVTSIAGRLAMAHATAYSMSKFAAQALNDCLRHELLSFGVAVISIEPDAFKTAMTRPDRVSEDLDSIRDTVPDDVKSDYGVEHLEKLKNFNNVLNFFSSPDVHKVVDDIETAISSKHPCTTYKPSTNAFFRTMLTICTIAPSSVHDLYYKLSEKFASLISDF